MLKAIGVIVVALGTIGQAAAMELTSSDFKEGAALNVEQAYPRCGGANMSPQLAWSGAPAGTKTFALTLLDFDAGATGWTHWLVAGLPSGTASLAKGAMAWPAGAAQLKNDFGDAKYDGPCPPKGSGVHHYQFTLWALPGAAPSLVGMKPAAIKATLEKAALAHATLTGTYERKAD